MGTQARLSPTRENSNYPGGLPIVPQQRDLNYHVDQGLRGSDKPCEGFLGQALLGRMGAMWRGVNALHRA